MDIFGRACYRERMPKPTRSRAQLALAAARGNLSAAASALTCTVEELRDVLRLPEMRGRPRKPTISAEEARAIVERGDRVEIARTGVRALARALDVPLSTLRGRLEVRAVRGLSNNRHTARK